jgi:ParB family chromosome partitioning protein
MHMHVNTQTTTEALQYLPLSALRIDELNARATAPSDAEIDELASLIASQGLLQNLTVIAYDAPRREKGKGKRKGHDCTHGVIAGGRRLRALQRLAQRGALPDDEQILCNVVPVEKARAVSVAENSGRADMSVVDTIIAFAGMVQDGASVDEIAVAFGIAPITVKRRLKLANVSPRLFDLFREGELELDQLQALALSDDHARQEAVWDGTPAHSRYAHNLRRLILGDSAPDKLVRFVGLEAYEQAGGVVLRDLFTGEGESGVLQDGTLVHTLAVAKLEQAAEQLRGEGLPWVEVRPVFNHSERQDFMRAPTAKRAPTEAEAQAMAALQTQMEELGLKIDAHYETDAEADAEGEDDSAKLQALEQQYDELSAQHDAIEDTLCTPVPDAVALAGAVVYVADSGQIAIERNLIRKADQKAVKQAVATFNSEQGQGGGAAEEGRGLSEALMRQLTAHRTRALQATMIDQHQIALAALAHPLILSMLYDPIASCQTPRSALGVNARGCDGQLRSFASDLDESRAEQAVQAATRRAVSYLPANAADLLPWLLKQPMDTLVELLALCASLTLDAISPRGGAHAADPLAEAVSLDMADWWQATGPSYLSRVPKALIVEAVTEAGLTEDAQALTKLKKGEAVERATTLLNGKRWLPAALR